MTLFNPFDNHRPANKQTAFRHPAIQHPAIPQATITQATITQATINQTIHSEAGTLLWIGDRLLPEFCNAYEVGENLAAQVAFRPDLLSSLDRPANEVHRIVYASNTRVNFDDGLWKQVRCQYGNASTIRLRGPLTEGIGTEKQVDFDEACDWREASEVIRSHFVSSPAFSCSGQPVVAVIASHYSAAEPLLELAESHGAVSLWRREPGLADVRGINMVWWDDSFAGPTDTQGWRDRMAAMGGSQVQHAWLAHRPHWLQTEQANQAGIDRVLGKPYQIDPLVKMIVGESAIEIQAPMTHAA